MEERGDGTGGGYPDTGFEQQLDELAAKFQRAYLKAKGFRTPLEADGPAEQPDPPANNSDTEVVQEHIDHARRLEAEDASSEADLTIDLSCFRGICAGDMLDTSNGPEASVRRAYDRIPAGPQNDIHLSMASNLAGGCWGPAAENYQWHLQLLDWSYENQRAAAGALVKIFGAYRRTVEAVRTETVEILKQGTDALEQVADAERGEATVDIMTLGAAALFGSITLTGGLGAAAVGAIAGFGSAAVTQAGERELQSQRLAGSADEILADTKGLLHQLQTRTEDRCRTLVSALDHISAAFDSKTFQGGAHGSWTGLSLPKPKIEDANSRADFRFTPLANRA